MLVVHMVAVALLINLAEGINSVALQQGGLGLLLTTMVISASPIAAAFFKGILGQFNSYSPFGHIKPEPANSRGGYVVPGTSSYVLAVINQSHERNTHQNSGQSSSFGSYSQLTGTGSNYASTPARIKKDGEMT